MARKPRAGAGRQPRAGGGDPFGIRGGNRAGLDPAKLVEADAYKVQGPPPLSPVDYRPPAHSKIITRACRSHSPATTAGQA